MPSKLEVNPDREADPGTIPQSEKEGSHEGITENHDMTSKDIVPDEVDMSKLKAPQAKE